jgi:hypothetical protein
MTSRTRLWVLVISTPVIAFALVGGYLGKVLARDETYQHLRIFQDVVSLVVDNYGARCGDWPKDWTRTARI